jgi:excisionase family DNA binding protein
MEDRVKPLGLSISETGKALGGEGNPLSRATIYRMINRGELEAFKVGARTLVAMASIEALTAAAPRLAACL